MTLKYPDNKHRAFLLLLILISAILFLNTFKNSFVWDDEDVIVKNTYIRSLKSIPFFFGVQYWKSPHIKVLNGQYRPLRSITFALDYFFWRLNPAGFHFTNLLLHILNVILIYFLIFRLAESSQRRRRLASSPHPLPLPKEERVGVGGLSWVKLFNLPFMTALFFAAHPIHTESVTWIKNRQDLLALLFLLSSFLFFIKFTSPQKGEVRREKFPPCGEGRGEKFPPCGEGRGEKFPLPPGERERVRGRLGILSYFASLFCFVLALFSKEMALSLPLVLVIYVLCFLPKIEYKKAITKILPFPGIAISFFAFKQLVLGRLVPSGHSHSIGFYSTILVVFKTIGQYIKLLIFPFNLNADRLLIVPESFFEPAVLWSAVLMLFCLIVAVRTIKRLKLVSFSIFWIFLTLLPVSNILFLSGRPIAEQRLYIPSLGFCILLAMGIMALPALKLKFIPRSILRNLAGLLFISILIFYSSATIKRNLDWKDPLTFWSKTLESSPNSARAHNNLGSAYGEMGKHEEAIKLYKKAIELSPAHINAYYNLGNAYNDIDEKEKAIAFYKKTIEMRPDYVKAYNNLGTVYKALGKQNESIDWYKKAIKVDPAYVDAYCNLGNRYIDLGDNEEAVRWYSKAIEINPWYLAAYNNLGKVYSDIGEYQEAIDLYEEGIKINPREAGLYNRLADLYYNLGNAYSGAGKYEEAIDLYKRATKINPDDVEAFNNLGNVYSDMGKYKEAEVFYKKVIELKPDYALVYGNLSATYFRQKRYKLAIEYCDKARELGFVEQGLLETLKPHRE